MSWVLWLTARLITCWPSAAVIAWAGGLVMLSCTAGCRSAPASAVDPVLARHARTASEAFHDGYDEQAVTRYRLALRRAWERDDATAIANTAFNLAACLAAMREYEPARAALAEARAELHRSGQSLVDAWLLEAKLARAEGRFEEATYLADCVIEPLIRSSDACRRGHCKDSAPSHAGPIGGALAATGQGILQGAAAGDRQHALCQSQLVSLALFRANLFLDQADIARASAELKNAQQIAAQVETGCSGSLAGQDPATRAEIASTQSRLLLLLERPLEAAQRLDDEVRWLKASEHYRELPMATAAAAEAFLQAGRPLEAAERLFRTARLLYGRDDLLASLYFLERAVELADQLGDVDLQLRGGLLLAEIDRANQQRGAATGDPTGSSEALTWPAEPAPREPPREELPSPPLQSAERATPTELSAPQSDR